MDCYKTLHNWLVLEMGFVRSENDKAMWMHPTRRLKIGSHVDDCADCILRGKRKHHTWFWSEAKKKFKMKHRDFVEVDQPQIVCSRLVQKQINGGNGVTRYSTTQEAATRAWLIEEDMWGCRTAQAPMPGKDEMLDDMRSVTPQEHK